MNPQRYRRRHVRSSLGVNVLESTGIGQETGRRRLPDSPAPGGPHQWVVTGVWRLSEEVAAAQATGSGEQVHLDLENLMAVDGPGCWVCEQIWTPAIAAAPCPGEPR